MKSVMTWFGALLLCLFSTSTYSAPPLPPMILFGQVWQSGVPVPEGTQILYELSGNELTTSVVDSGLGYSFYTLEIPNRDLQEPRKEETIQIVRVGDVELREHGILYRPSITVAHHLDVETNLPPQAIHVSVADIYREENNLILHTRFAWQLAEESLERPEQFIVQWFLPGEEPDLPSALRDPQILKAENPVVSELSVPSIDVVANRLYLVIIPVFAEDRQGQAVFHILPVPLGAEFDG